MSSDIRNWLEGLKVGDEVMVPQNYGLPPQFGRVSKLTATQIVVGIRRYRRKNGHEVGGDKWASTYIAKPTQDGRDRHEDRLLRDRLLTAIKSPTTGLDVLRAMSKATQP